MRKLILSFAFIAFCGNAFADDLDIPATTSASNPVSVASVNYVEKIVDAMNIAIGTKATDTTVVHLEGTETITGDKTFNGSLLLGTVIADDADNTQAATTAWTNNKIKQDRGWVPLDGPTSDEYIQIWVQR